ncbi:MAG TPA: PQQ-binding-like beta-propeller repeat protein [Vicinamibacterales bacterium]|nr:PQQ-binding-like beta-propeller repeat protein [Vicinamibacterales bacterium]
MKRSALFVATLALAGATLSAENWPQWRGPLATGATTEKGLPEQWSVATGENIAWKLPMPSRSGATPIIWNDTIFLNVAQQPSAGDVELWSVDRRTGQVNWKKPVAPGNFRINKQNMSSPSPVTDGRTVWVLTGLGVLKAFDYKGTELWARDIQKDYGQFGLNWGYAASPLLHEGMLYIPVLHGMKTDDPSYVLKIDGKTGKTLWKVERPTDALVESPDAYTTPALLQYGSTKEVVVTGGDVVTGHDLATGKELWRAEGLNPDKARNYRIVASPIVAGGLVIAPTRIRPMIAIKPGGRGNVTATHTAWTFDRGPDVPTPATDGTLLYSVDDRGIVHALDVKTGAVVYGPERLKPAIYSASPVLADGKIYVTSEEGLTSVFRAGPKFQLLAENPTEEYTLSTIAVAQGQLFLRTEKHLYAIGKGAATTATQK